MNTTQPGDHEARVYIPRTPLGRKLEAAAGIKRTMAKLLAELEQSATGTQIPKPGGWRHDPQGWGERHKHKAD